MQTPPEIERISPDIGPVSGGTTVTIESFGTGTGNFSGASAVRFGDVPAASFTVISDSTITAVSPPHPEGVVHVTVTTPGGTSAAGDCIDDGQGDIGRGAQCNKFNYYGELGGGAWATTGQQSKGSPGRATVLRSGKVLFTSLVGYDTYDNATGRTTVSGAELYDPATGQWSSCPEAAASPACPGPMVASSAGHTATLLKDGRVLIAGGYYADRRAEIYDPATGKFTKTGDLSRDRYLHTATLLADGRVLVAGGEPDANLTIGRLGNSAEIYNPATGEWTAAKPMPEGVSLHTATLLGSRGGQLAEGKVLVAGGEIPPNAINATSTDSSQLYDPVLDVWTRCPTEAGASPACPAPFLQLRDSYSATVLADGRILAAGGKKARTQIYSTVEIYDPGRGVWTQTGRMGQARAEYVAARLPNGKVLVAGGNGRGGRLSSAELYNPDSGRWTWAPFMPDGSAQAAATLPIGPWAACASNCGKVLVARGNPFDGRNVRSLLFSPTPEVAAVRPPRGSSAGGTPVAITGTGLASVSSVKFGGVEAQRIDPDGENPDGKLVAVAPPHAPGVVDVTVTTDGGRSAAVPAARFTYVEDGGTGTTPAGALTQGTILGSTPVKRPTSSGAPSVSETSDLKRCLAAVASHKRSEQRLARRGSARQRARARRHLTRHAASGRRRCLLPGRVRDLKANALSASTIMLTFSTPGSVGASPPPAGRYILKQSPRPITSERDFRRAGTLCGGLCRFKPTRLGQRINLTITGLQPHTTYYYAIKAVGASNRAGARSHTTKATTRQRSRP